FACDSYTWAVNGQTYTQSGTYTSVTGCHTETLVLTIVPSTSNTTTASACDNYTWAVNGQTYTQSGTYTSVTGCHTETLLLTIVPSTSNTTPVLAYDTYTWALDGQTYTQSGSYLYVTGCHTETLLLTIVASAGTTTVTTSTTLPADFTLNKGTLIAANVRQNGTINGSGTLMVTGSGSIGGNGSVGNLVVNGGGKIKPGLSPGDLQAASAELGPDGIFEFEINDATGTAGADPGWDRLSVLGDVTITATAENPWVVRLVTLSGSVSGPAANFACGTAYRWPFVTSGGTISAFDAEKFVVDATGFANAFSPAGFTVELNQTDNSLEVVYAGAPPPPPLACYETATFNTATCQWEVSGTQPPQPPLACYETATFNTATCQWDVSGSDNIPPTFTTVEAGGSASADANCQALVPNVVDGSEAVDINCPPTAPANQLASVPPSSAVTITQDPAAGTPVGPGETTITLTATDAAGNSTTATTTFTVSDTTAPTFTTVEDGGSASADANCQAAVPDVVDGSAATDNCPGVASAGGLGAVPPPSVTITQSPAAGTLVGLGVTTITLTATDAAGNSTTATTTFTVSDTTPPTITCPAYDQVPTVVNRTDATALDNCSVTLTWTINGQTPIGDTVTLPPGCHTLVWTAIDGAGNTATCTKTVRTISNLSLEYTGDQMVFTSGPTVNSAKVALGARLKANGTPNVAFGLLSVKFEVWTSGASPSKVTEITAPVNTIGEAGALVTLTAGSTTAATYEVRAYLVQGTCNVGANDISGQTVVVDYGSTTRRVVGGGWIRNAYSDNAKGTFGFVAGFTTKVKTVLEGNSVFMLHRVQEGGLWYNWKVKDNSWNNATLSFYHNPALPGTTVDSGRVTFRGVVQKIDPVTGAVMGGLGNATIVLDAFDGDLYKPAVKDQYAIKVYDQNNLLWWGSTPSTAPNPGLPLANGGTGGGNIKIFSK
ncbi:MAG: hypothetical protein ACKOET_03215, partial [Verrucomicrobiota bacterium]